MSDLDIHHTAALAPPAGTESDFNHPYTLHPYLVMTVAVCLTISVVAVVARSYTRKRLLDRFDTEDYALIFAVLGFAAFSAVMLSAGNAGQGRHQWNVTIAGLQRMALLANILEILYPPVMFAAKFSILIQIKRIFTSQERGTTYWSVQVLIWLNLLVYIALLFAFIFACWPREKIWEPQVPGRCISTNVSIIATSAINILSDFTILFLPLLNVARLRLSKKKKLGVLAVFGTGFFACIASVVRLYYSIKLTQTHDISWAIAPVGMWALAEIATVILVGCFPTFPRLWKHITGRDEKSHYVSSSNKSYEKKPKPSFLDSIDPRSQWHNESTSGPEGEWIPLDSYETGKSEVPGPSRRK